MRRLFVAVLVIAAVFVGLGFYLDWFNISTGSTGEPGKTSIDLTIDKDKMKSDAKDAKEKLKGLGSKLDPSAGKSTDATKD